MEVETGLFLDLNFAGFVNTGIGKLGVVADSNFTRADIGGGNFQASIWAFRMTHNGEPLVYQLTQIPFGVRDLVPGCTAISFEVWGENSFSDQELLHAWRISIQFTGRLNNYVLGNWIKYRPKNLECFS